MRHYPHGLGASEGDGLVTEDNLYTTCDVLYVHSGTGDDDASGTSRGNPLATLGAAVTVANSNTHTIIVLMDGHSETITSAVVATARVCIVGEGTDADGSPSPKLRSNMSSGTTLSTTAPLFQMRNVTFRAPLQAKDGPELEMDASVFGFWLKGVRFEIGAGSRGPALRLDQAQYPLLEDVTFALLEDADDESSVGAAATLEAVTSPRMRRVTFTNAGSFRWPNAGVSATGYAYLEPQANTYLQYEQMRLAGDSVMSLHASTTVTHIQCDEMTGGSHIEGSAAVQHMPNGVGSALGPALITNPNLYTTGTIRFVDSVNGDDGNSGLSRNLAWATIENAVTQSSDGDMIVLVDGHSETTSAELTVGALLVICGEGEAAGLPTVTFLDANQDAAMFALEAAASGSSIRNLRIDAPSVASGMISFDVSNCLGLELDSILFEATDDTGDQSIDVGGTVSGLTLRNLRWQSSGSGSVGVTPIQVGSTSQDFKIIDCILDNGTAGPSGGLIYFEKTATDGIFFDALTLLRDARAGLDVDSNGWAYVPVATGMARVDWTSDP